MRVDRRLFPRLHEGFELVVKGVDMFGAPFLESTQASEPEQGGSLFPAVEANFSWRPARVCVPIQRCTLKYLGSWPRSLGFRKV